MIVFALAVVSANTGAAQIINTLRGFDDDERGWSGEIAGGIALAEGNTQYFEFELDGKVQRRTGRHRWRAIGVIRRRTALGMEVAESRSTHLRYNYRLWARVYSIAFLQAQYDPFLHIETRLLVGAGARIEVLEGDAWKSAIGLALMHEAEELTTEIGEFTNRPRFSAFLTLYRAEEKGFDIDFWGFYQPLVDDFTDARVSLAASARVDIVGGMYFLVNYVARLDTNPAQGVKRLDQTLRSGLGWDF